MARIAQPKAIAGLPVRLDALSKSLDQRFPIVWVKGLEDPALLYGLSEDLIEGRRDQRGKVRTQEDQAALVIELEDQVRRIPDQRAVAILGIAQFGGLLVELPSKPAQLLDEFRSVLFPVPAQRLTSWWKASQSAPHLTSLICRYKPLEREITSHNSEARADPAFG